MANAAMEPSDYQLEAQQLERRRKLAEAMQQNALTTGMPQGQMVSGRYVAPSWTQQLAQAIKPVMARQELNQIDAQQKDLYGRQRERSATDTAAFMEALQGKPATPGIEAPAEDNAGPWMQPQAAVAGDKQKALAIALQSQSPMLQGAGSAIMSAMLKPGSWSVAERYNATTGLPEKVAVNTADPTQVIPIGGQKGVSADTAAKEKGLNDRFGGVSGNTQATLKQGDEHWKGLSGYQAEELPIQRGQLAVSQGNLGVNRGQLANSQANTYFNTGMGVPGAGGGGGSPPIPQIGAQVPMQPQGAPQQSPVPPQSVPGAPPGMQPGVVTPKDLAKRAADRPHQEQALRNVNMSLDASLKQIDDLLKSPGIENISGPIAGRTWNMSGAATNAQAKLDTLKAQIGVEVLQAMREASKTGGAVGQVTEKEWPILQNQLGALQQAQTTDEFKKGLAEVRARIDNMKRSADTAFQSVYGSGNVLKFNAQGNQIP